MVKDIPQIQHVHVTLTSVIYLKKKTTQFWHSSMFIICNMIRNPYY